MSRETRIRQALAALMPTQLEIMDESAKHAGHAGARPGGETHYAIRIESALFKPLSRVEAQRKVNALLKEEFDSGLHALALTIIK